MPIYRLLQNTAFDPVTIDVLASAFEDICRELGLAERSDPLRDAVARKVIEIAQTGVREPLQIRAATLTAIRE